MIRFCVAKSWFDVLYERAGMMDRDSKVKCFWDAPRKLNLLQRGLRAPLLALRDGIPVLERVSDWNWRNHTFCTAY